MEVFAKRRTDWVADQFSLDDDCIV
ncbi:uncharacterized protein METZ01_LOCUS187189 [marine metagenome]|uniref:Uncharacterized protein n=1 Tax=marine metagenome TaxID=408172 RepID=A0A382D7W5_9ZZZZ